jgi:hypothetical protein
MTTTTRTEAQCVTLATRDVTEGRKRPLNSRHAGGTRRAIRAMLSSMCSLTRSLTGEAPPKPIMTANIIQFLERVGGVRQSIDQQFQHMRSEERCLRHGLERR